jgi:hypothetical protein
MAREEPTMSENELFDERNELVETEDGFVRPAPADESKLDSEIDFDDEEYTAAEEELIGEEEAGNAEGGIDAHLDDPEKVDDDLP